MRGLLHVGNRSDHEDDLHSARSHDSVGARAHAYAEDAALNPEAAASSSGDADGDMALSVEGRAAAYLRGTAPVVDGAGGDGADSPCDRAA